MSPITSSYVFLDACIIINASESNHFDDGKMQAIMKMLSDVVYGASGIMT